MPQLEAVAREKGDLKISVDPRIELLISVQLNSDYFRLTKLESRYRDEMEDFFSRYTTHPAIKNFKKLSDAGFTYDAPPTAALFFDQPLKFHQHTDFTEYLINRAGGQGNINGFFLTVFKTMRLIPILKNF